MLVLVHAPADPPTAMPILLEALNRPEVPGCRWALVDTDEDWDTVEPRTTIDMLLVTAAPSQTAMPMLVEALFV